jgi:diguanylate cyclase (GGDEF)-like protein
MEWRDQTDLHDQVAAGPDAVLAQQRQHGVRRRLVEDVAPPSGLMAMALWACAGAGLFLLLGTLILVVAERDRTPAWLVVAAAVAIVVTIAVWYRAYRRGGYHGREGTVDAIAVFLVAVTLDSVSACGGLLVVRTFLGSLFPGPLPGKMARCGLGIVALIAGLLLAAGPMDPAVGPLLLAGPTLLAATLMFHLLGIGLTRADHAFADKRILFWAAGQFAGRLEPQRISEVTLVAAVRLAAEEMPGSNVRAAVAIGPADRLEVRATTRCLDQAIGALLRLDSDRVGLVLPDQPQARPLVSLLDEASTTARVEPIAARGTVYGVLLFDAAAPVHPDLRPALGWLCCSAGLALAGAALTAELSSLAFHDRLTRLPNRVLLGERTDTALARAARNGTTVALLVLELDGFKRINDRYGHRVGDETLVIVAARLRDQLREVDVAARLGGDEFALLLTDLHDPAEATMVARRVLAALSQPLQMPDDELMVGVSIGVVTWSAPPSSLGPRPRQDGPRPGLDRLLDDADTAMYLAKSRGTGYEVVSERSPAEDDQRLPPDPAPRAEPGT